VFGWCSEQLRHWSKRGLSPPREEDRKLPLHKLFENLQEFEQTVPASVRCTLSGTTASAAQVDVSLRAYRIVTIFHGFACVFPCCLSGASFAKLYSPLHHFLGRS